MRTIRITTQRKVKEQPILHKNLLQAGAQTVLKWYSTQQPEPKPTKMANKNQRKQNVIEIE